MSLLEIDKKKFGSFVAERRKRKGLTQKELAAKLYISDKAVSKWETGISLPDTTLLIPLADLLDVSVTELLMCEKMEPENPVQEERVEKLVKTAITYAGQNPERAYQKNRKWIAICVLSFMMGLIGTLLNYTTGQPVLNVLGMIELLCVIFGFYFCCFVRTRLSAFYDENDISFYHDGIFSMRIAGLRLNNRNWPSVIRASRISTCSLMTAVPFLNLLAGTVIPDIWALTGGYLLLVIFLCTFFIPVYLAGKKYISMHSGSRRKS